jgi:RNA polymerase sigma-70 factor (ECF subfamily)
MNFLAFHRRGACAVDLSAPDLPSYATIPIRSVNYVTLSVTAEESVLEPIESPLMQAEQLIVRAIREGDARVAPRFYELLRPVVDRVLCRVLGGRDSEHEDIVQLSFEQIVASVVSGRYRAECSLTTWATVVASRVALSELRRRTRKRHVELLSEPVSDVDQEQRLEARRRLRCLKQALARLSSERAEAVYLRDVEGYSELEMSQLLGISRTAVHSRVVRGRRELRSLMAQLLEGHHA